MFQSCLPALQVETPMGTDDDMKSMGKCMMCCGFCYFPHGHHVRRASPTRVVHPVDPPKPVASDCKATESDACPMPTFTKPRPSGCQTTVKKAVSVKGLNSMIREGRRSKRLGNLIRASSNNVMIFGNLGNVKRKKNSDILGDVFDYLPKTAEELSEEANANVKSAKGSEALSKEQLERLEAERLKDQLESLDADGLKEKGNEEYKNGRYAEAVALYERAIAKDQERASYWSNKAAALISLGRLLEAVADCKTAVRIDPTYYRAHYRLGTLYLR